jgi:hypothetical protein
VGPDGSGKSHILEQAIENRKMVVYLDLQREPGTLHFRFLPMMPLTPYHHHACAPHSNQWRGDPHAVHQQDQLHSSAHGTPSIARALWPSWPLTLLASLRSFGFTYPPTLSHLFSKKFIARIFLKDESKMGARSSLSSAKSRFALLGRNEE